MKKSVISVLMAAALLGFNVASGFAASPGKDTLTALQQSLPYNRTMPQSFPDFTYESPADAPLVHLREKYRLDSVAGSGSDIDRVIRLLGWFHDQVPHNDVRAHAVLNAENIIDTYRNTKVAQGCYGLAISLDEILLSEGFKARTVICFSNEYPEPKGGHVINSVFIPSVGKWIYADPQENAYIKDDRGNFLSIVDVRERLVHKLPLVLNKTANYHGVRTKADEYLDQFMGTHLYRMICPLHSMYNSETRSDGKTLEYVELLPYGGKEPPMTMIETQQKASYKVVCYHTSNDEAFWKAPVD